MSSLNAASYEAVYSGRRDFLRYPADWVIRFWNLYLRQHIPSGRVLDYGCGSGNNAKFFLDKGYQVTCTDVAPAVRPLIEENGVLGGTFILTDPEKAELPIADGYFDFILSNQVLYYLSEPQLRKVSAELHRCLRPGGVVMFTMMGPRNYYIARYSKDVGGGLYDIRLPGNHRLAGRQERILLARDPDHIRDLFSVFSPLSVGYFDQSMMEMESNFHFIFVGTRN